MLQAWICTKLLEKELALERKEDEGKVGRRLSQSTQVRRLYSLYTLVSWHESIILRLQSTWVDRLKCWLKNQRPTDSLLPTLDEGNSGGEIGVFFCGDMNSTPPCGVPKLMLDGRIDPDHPEWRSCEAEEVRRHNGDLRKLHQRLLRKPQHLTIFEKKHYWGFLKKPVLAKVF